MGGDDVTEQAPERIWVYTGSVLNGVPSWEWGLAYEAGDMEESDWPQPVNFVRADMLEEAVKALEASSQYVEVLHSLTPKGQARNDLMDNLRKTRTTLAKLRSKT